MNPTNRTPFFASALFLTLIALASFAPLAAAADGLTGAVSSANTGNMLQGATVEIPRLRKTVVTDSGGQFTLTGVPAGEYEIIVSYPGLAEQRRTIVVGERASRLNFELGAAVIALGKFTVASQREGNALAIANQRNAPNLKNAVSLDAFGNMPNMGVGELMMRVPGVAPIYDDEGNVGSISVRGMPAETTTTTIDGTPTFRGNGARQISYLGLTGAIFEQVELTKGHMPDQTANSLGGSVNLKTRSPLSMSERQRITYNATGRWGPPFLVHSAERRNHPLHPLLNLSYQRALDVFGGERNLGVSVGLFYSENVNSGSLNAYMYQNTISSPAYLYDYRSTNETNNRHITTANVKFEYRPSPRSKLTFGLIYNQGDEPAIDRSQIRFFTAQSIAALAPNSQPTGNGAILPNFTDTRTEARALPASNVELTTAHLSLIARSPTLSFGGEHTAERFDLDYKVAHTFIHLDRGVGTGGDGGTVTMTAPGIGWAIDRTNPASPRVVQTGGPNIYNPASYTNPVQHTNRDQIEQTWAFTSEINASFRPRLQQPLTFKGGLFFERRINNRTMRGDKQWTRVAGAPPLPYEPYFVTLFDEYNGGRMPAINPRVTAAELSNPARWTEDRYYHEMQKLSQTKYATEDVYAGYVMARGKVGPLGVLGGVRTEYTEVEGEGNVRRRPATAAQIPDPAERARYDWGVHITDRGSYTRSFPSVHFTYDLLPDLKARASWSTSFSRPPFNNLVPTATINDAAQTVTEANPGLGPQYSKNLDLSLEYFFRPAGFLTVGYFEKTIEDYILITEVGTVASGANNGYAGDYAGYRVLSRTNAGEANVKGWELSYRQQFVFLPGALKGFELAANFTYLTTQGDFGGTDVRKNNEVPNFIPKVGNVSLAYNYGLVGTRVTYNYTSDYLRTFNAAPALRLFQRQLETVMLGVSYRWRPGVTFSMDMSNVLAARRKAYRFTSSRIAEVNLPNQAISFGINGSF
ncbi:MAG: TonB-dependent receptor [Opitutus sp.]|nr:TonB-dependent receptor [Opitutus sp.]